MKHLTPTQVFSGIALLVILVTFTVILTMAKRTDAPALAGPASTTPANLAP